MSNSWASFIHDLNPNNWSGRNGSIPAWPGYDNSNPLDLVFDANVTSFVESDTYRAVGMKLITDNNLMYRR